MTRPRTAGQRPTASERVDRCVDKRAGANLFRASVLENVYTLGAALWTLAMLVLALIVGTP